MPNKRIYLISLLLTAIICTVTGLGFAQQTKRKLIWSEEFNGKTLPVMDDAPVLEKFKVIWSTNDLGEVAKATLSEISFWDTDLTEVPGLTEAVTNALKEIDANGIEQGYKNFIQ